MGQANIHIVARIPRRQRRLSVPLLRVFCSFIQHARGTPWRCPNTSINTRATCARTYPILQVHRQTQRTFQNFLRVYSRTRRRRIEWNRENVRATLFRRHCEKRKSRARVCLSARGTRWGTTSWESWRTRQCVTGATCLTNGWRVQPEVVLCATVGINRDSNSRLYSAWHRSVKRSKTEFQIREQLDEKYYSSVRGNIYSSVLISGDFRRREDSKRAREFITLMRGPTEMEIDHHGNLDPVKFEEPFVYFSSFGDSSILSPFFFLFFFSPPPKIGGPYFRNGCTVA